MAVRCIQNWPRRSHFNVSITQHVKCLCGTFGQYRTIHFANVPYSPRRLDRFRFLYSTSNNSTILDIKRYHHLCSAFTAGHNKNALFSNQILRNFHCSTLNYDKSKVEDSLKEKRKKKESDIKNALEKPMSTVSASSESESSKGVVTPVQKKPLWDRIVAEVKHYYHGFRLLALDVRIAAKTLYRILRGNPVSRRERNQFKRALSDIFRLAPFSIFIIIPFAELALPIVVRLFPSLLPSTFEDKTARESRLRKELSVKLQMAKFMQDTVEDIAMRSKKSSKDNLATENFALFFQKIRTTDEEPTNVEILQHAKLFEDELTLDSMSRPQLIALCRLIQVPAVGSNNLLRFLLQTRLNRLHADDTMIQREGIDSLNVRELQTACQARGMRALGMSEQRIKQQLQQWIDLHLNHDVPSSLLLLSRVLFMPENVPVEKMVKEAISALPEKVADEAEVRAAELNCERIDNTKRYKVTKQEQLDIAKEEAEEIQKEKDKKLEDDKKQKQEAEWADIKETVAASEGPILQDNARAISEDESLTVTGSSIETLDEGPVLKDPSPVSGVEISREEIDALDKAIGAISNEDSLDKTKSELEDLREDLVEYQQDVLSLDKNLLSEEDEIIMKEKKASSRLQKKIAGFIGNMDKIVAELEEKQEGKDEDSDERQSISVEDLKLHLNKYVEIIPEEKLNNIADLLDANKDGRIDLDEVMKAFEALDSENVSVTSDQLHQLLGTIQTKEDEKKPDL